MNRHQVLIGAAVTAVLTFHAPADAQLGIGGDVGGSLNGAVGGGFSRPGAFDGHGTGSVVGSGRVGADSIGVWDRAERVRSESAGAVDRAQGAAQSARETSASSTDSVRTHSSAAADTVMATGSSSQSSLALTGASASETVIERGTQTAPADVAEDKAPAGEPQVEPVPATQPAPLLTSAATASMAGSGRLTRTPRSQPQTDSTDEERPRRQLPRATAHADGGASGNGNASVNDGSAQANGSATAHGSASFSRD